MSDKEQQLEIVPNEAPKVDPEQLKLEAQMVDKNIDTAAVSHNKRSMEIGWYGAIMIRKNYFGILGFKSEDEYRTKKGIGRSTWYDMVKIGEKFESITKTQFLTMKAGNAKLLSKLPKETRLDPKLIEKAATLTVDKFEKHLIDKGYTQKEEAETSDGTDITKVKEMPITFKMQMFQNRLLRIMEGIHEFQAAHQITDESQALELIVVEVSGAKHYASIFTESLPKLKSAMQEDGSSAEDYGAKIKRALEDHILAISEVLDRKGVKLQKAS